MQMIDMTWRHKQCDVFFNESFTLSYFDDCGWLSVREIIWFTLLVRSPWLCWPEMWCLHMLFVCLLWCMSCCALVGTYHGIGPLLRALPRSLPLDDLTLSKLAAICILGCVVAGSLLIVSFPLNNFEFRCSFIFSLISSGSILKSGFILNHIQT